MNGSGNFPIDLLLYGMIAAFLVLRLRSVLGRRTGFERSKLPEAVADIGLSRPTAVARVEPPSPTRTVPDPASATGQVLAAMVRFDRNFDPARFLDGAEAAFRMIVSAYAQGDRVALQPLLTEATYAGFEGAIAARETAGETQRSEIRAVPTVAIEEAVLNGVEAAITVRFVSDQIAETLDRDGKPVAGTDAMTEIIDLWTFERDLTSRDPAWRLAGARSG